MFSYGSPVYFFPVHPSRAYCNHYRPRSYNRCSDSYSPFFSMRDIMEARQAEEERLYRQKLAEEQAREMRRRKPRERNANLGSDKPRARKIPIASSDEDQAKAAQIISRFIKSKRSTRQIRQILQKLRQLRSIQGKLGEIRSSFTPGPLTFTADSQKRIFPITTENKEFLKNEESVMKILDELDGIQSAGADIVRQRRREIVKYAQNVLETFDIDRDKQWTAFNENKASNSLEELTSEERENTDQATDIDENDQNGKESVNARIENQEVDDEEIRPYVIKEKELENSSSDSDDDSVNGNLIQDVEIKDSTMEENEDRITQSSSNAGGDDIEVVDRDSVNPDTDESVEEAIDELVDGELSTLDVNSDNTDLVEDEFILV